MRRFQPGLRRLLVTAAAVAAAVLAGWQLWARYMEDPWTRDGRVRADVIGMAPDVSGLVAEVLVRDNQSVRKGAVLFRVDRARFVLALRTANAVVSSRLAALQQAVRETNRYRTLSNAEVSQQKPEQTEAEQAQAIAADQQAMADRDPAQLNLDRTEVTAPANGTVANFDLRPGDYVSAGRPVTALVDEDSLHIDGYFEETKLQRSQLGDPVRVRLLGLAVVLAAPIMAMTSPVFHELATNAAKHGALPAPRARPTSRGVGSHLLEHGLPAGGTAALDHLPGGLGCGILLLLGTGAEP